MIRIKKLENAFGIKKIILDKLPDKVLEKNLLIYAPNGTMKTSFSESLEKIGNNTLPSDFYAESSDSKCCFEIQVNDNSITENDIDNDEGKTVFPVVAFTNNYYNETNKIEKSELTYALSKELLISYREIDSNYENAQKESISLFRNIFGFDSRTGENTIKNHLAMIISDFKSYYEIVNYLLSFEKEPNAKKFLEKLQLNKFKIKDFFTVNFIRFCELENNINNFDLVEKNLNSLLDSSLFPKKNDSFVALQEVHKTAEKYQFYQSQYGLNINSEKNSREEIQKIIDDTIEFVFSSGEKKDIYEKIQESTKNGKLNKQIEFIKNNIDCLSDLKRIKYTYISVVCEKLSEFETDSKIILKKYHDIMTNSELFKNKAENDLSAWKNTVQEFAEKFKNTSLEFDVCKNKTDSENLFIPSVPRLTVKNRANGKEMNLRSNRMSNGEKKSWWILNLVFKIKKELSQNKNFLVILDDIVESFDYQNKFAILNYIKDISTKENIQLIILTHNFDFYSNCKQQIKNIESLSATRDSTSGHVALIPWKNNGFNNLGFYKNWKNSDNIVEKISIIPFARNLFEITEKEENWYNDSCQFLHFNREKTVNDLITFLNNNNLSIKCECLNMHKDKKYMDFLGEQALGIREEKCTEIDLNKKLMLSIWCRIRNEKIICDYLSSREITPSKTHENYELVELIEQLESLGDVPKDLKDISNTTSLCIQNVIHLNGFSIEPLVDLSFKQIFDILKKLDKLNCQFTSSLH